MAIQQSEDRIVIETPAWHRFVLRLNGPMVAGDVLIPDSLLPMSPRALVNTMRRLHRAAQHSAPRGETNRRPG